MSSACLDDHLCVFRLFSGGDGNSVGTNSFFDLPLPKAIPCEDDDSLVFATLTWELMDGVFRSVVVRGKLLQGVLGHEGILVRILGHWSRCHGTCHVFSRVLHCLGFLIRLPLFWSHPDSDPVLSLLIGRLGLQYGDLSGG